LSDADIALYTGLEDVVSIAPLLVLVTYVFGAIAVGGYSAKQKFAK
jgi:hypothetical protein